MLDTEQSAGRVVSDALQQRDDRHSCTLPRLWRVWIAPESSTFRLVAELAQNRLHIGVYARNYVNVLTYDPADFWAYAVHDNPTY